MSAAKRLLTGVLVGLLVLPTVTLAAEKNSGFLENYSGLQPDSDRTGAKIYRKVGTSLGKYDKIALEPIEIWYHPKSKYKGIDPDQMKAVTGAFYGAIVDALEPKYPVVDKPGAGVLQVRLAVTNVNLKKKKRGLLSFTPIGLAVTAAKDAAGKRISMAGATLEAELFDAQTGERIGALVDLKPQDSSQEKPSWDSIENTLKFYAKRFRARLDEAHKR